MDEFETWLEEFSKSAASSYHMGMVLNKVLTTYREVKAKHGGVIPNAPLYPTAEAYFKSVSSTAEDEENIPWDVGDRL